ncbi:MAG TPA: type II toxin-antitoxin system HicB family antitoxin [Armatimonadota bacterium]|jgi:predicted RNase H-like HicB family nuclease
MEFRVVVESQNNLFHAYCPNLKGCHSWGSTMEEAMLLIEEALQFYVDSVEDDEEEDAAPEISYSFPLSVN